MIPLLGADVVLMQEASKAHLPANPSYRVSSSAADNWLITNGGNAAATAIAVFNPDLKYRVIPIVPLGSAVEGTLESSHLGQFTAIQIPFHGRTLTLVSLYAIWRGEFADATLHRAISDLTPLITRENEVLVVGDMNIFRGYTLGGGEATLKRYNAVFERFASLGLDVLGPYETGPLAGCPCKSDDCRHVRTYRHLNHEDSHPLQLDFAFGTKGVANAMISCRVMDDERWWAASDHAPIEVTLHL